MVIDIEDIDVKNILTKSQIADNMLVANPYVGCAHACIYCYATFMIRFTGHAGQKWGEFIDIKHWEPLTERKKKNLKDVIINISSVTDAYQPIEKKVKRTQELLNELIDTEATIQILTKSTLVLRDIPILKQHLSHGKVAIGFSINTLDESYHKELDKGSPISERINALKILHDEGFYTYVFIAPIMPVITDVNKLIDILSKIGVNEVWLDRLNLQSTTAKHNISKWLQKHEELKRIYEDLDSEFNNIKHDTKEHCRNKSYIFKEGSPLNFNSKSFTVVCFF